MGHQGIFGNFFLENWRRGMVKFILMKEQENTQENSQENTNLSSTTDEDLLGLAQLGNQEAFVTLYERHKKRILSYSYTILGESEGPWDVLQETFLYLLKKLPTYRPEAKFTTLLYKVVKNLSVALAKKKRRFISAPEEILEDTPSYLEPPEAELFQKDEVQRIEGFILSLPNIYREVLYLKIVEDLEYREISDILDCPLGTVKSRIHYGWKKIRESVEKKSKKFSL